MGLKIPYCPKCGERVGKSDEFCSSCGNKLEVEDTESNSGLPSRKEPSSKIEDSDRPSEKEGDEGWSTKEKIGVGVLGIIAIITIILATIGHKVGPQTPKRVAESYSKNWIDSSPEEAYELLSSSAKKEMDYSDFQTKVEAWNAGMDMQGASLKVDKVEKISENENRAVVKVVYELEKMTLSVTQEKEMELVKENESWKMKKAYLPV